MHQKDSQTFDFHQNSHFFLSRFCHFDIDQNSLYVIYYIQEKHIFEYEILVCVYWKVLGKENMHIQMF